MPHAIWMPVHDGETHGSCYRDLSKQPLKPTEKKWICDGIIGNLDEDDMNWNELQGGHEDIETMLCCQTDITTRYKVSKGTVSGWFKRIKQSLPLFQQGAGQPLAISKDRIKQVANLVISRQNVNKAPDKNEMKKLLHKARQDTYLDNTNNDVSGVGNVKAINKKTETNALSDCHGRFLKPNKLTTAREVSGLDPLTAISWGILILAFAGKLPATHKINFDGTSCEIKDGTEGHRVFIVKKDPDDVPLIIDNVRSSSQQISTSLFIKLMHIVAASGEKGPMVAILAWKDLPPGVFYSGEVLGLCNTSEVRRGILYIAKTRAGNPALWRDFFLQVLIPWIINHTTLHDKDVRTFI